MQIRIGTSRYNIYVGLFFKYHLQEIFNFIEFGISGVFFFAISTYKPYIIIGKDEI